MHYHSKVPIFISVIIFLVDVWLTYNINYNYLNMFEKPIQNRVHNKIAMCKINRYYKSYSLLGNY